MNENRKTEFLTNIRQIMRLHGGTLKYRPGAEGTGSIFTMTFK